MARWVKSIRIHRTQELTLHVRTADALPTEIRWGNAWHPIQHIALTWQLDLYWWRARIHRDYYKLLAGGMALVIYHDLLTDAWALQRFMTKPTPPSVANPTLNPSVCSVYAHRSVREGLCCVDWIAAKRIHVAVRKTVVPCGQSLPPLQWGEI